MQQPKPAVAVACLLFNRRRILLSRRPKMPQQNSWQCPGGFVHVNETLQAAGQRILQKKLGISLSLQATPFHSNNIFKKEQQHSLTIYFSAACSEEQIDQKQWQWFELNELPQSLFLPLQILFSQHANELSQLSHQHLY